MRTEATANCERLRERFQNREAIFVEQGALRVRVTNIEAKVAEQRITADLEELPTPGFPRFVGLNSIGLREGRRLQWTICAGQLTAFSNDAWSHGDGGWSLFFDSDLIREVVRFAAGYSIALERDAYESYRNIVASVRCHHSTQQRLTAVFPTGASHGAEVAPRPDPPPLIAAGIVLEDSERILKWGTPLHQMVADEAVIKWCAQAVLLSWPDRTAFHGLRCDVEAGRWFGPPEPACYHLYLGEFHSATLSIDVDWDADEPAREQGFRDLYVHLERWLGPATFSYPPFERRRLPSIHWEFRGIDVGYSLLGARPSLHLSHEPAGYPSLKADARAIAHWQGPGARVEYVAWPDPRRA